MRAKSEREIAADRALALLAILCTAAYDYGPRIWMLGGIAAGVSLLTEWIFLYIRKQKFTAKHLDAAVSGLILLMLMPPAVSVSLLIMSCIFANIIGRQLFGGKENPVIPTAAAGYCFALLNDRIDMTSFPAEKLKLPLFSIDPETLTAGVTDAFNHDGAFPNNIYGWLAGLPNQPIGTCSVVLLIVIALVLMLRRSLSAWTAIPMLFFVIVSNLIFAYLRKPEMTVIGSLLTNQLLFSIIFLYGDPDFAPPNLAGSLFGILAAGCIAVLTRVLFVYDAPVLLTVLLSPLQIWLRLVMQIPESTSQKRKGGSDQHAKTVRRSPDPQ